MVRQNVGVADAIFRSLLGCALAYLGLVTLDGRRGEFVGILVALVSALPFYMAITRRCFVFHWLNISSIPRRGGSR
jgi:hypothetical protein